MNQASPIGSFFPSMCPKEKNVSTFSSASAPMPTRPPAEPPPRKGHIVTQMDESALRWRRRPPRPTQHRRRSFECNSIEKMGAGLQKKAKIRNSRRAPPPRAARAPSPWRGRIGNDASPRALAMPPRALRRGPAGRVLLFFSSMSWNIELFHELKVLLRAAFTSHAFAIAAARAPSASMTRAGRSRCRRAQPAGPRAGGKCF